MSKDRTIQDSDFCSLISSRIRELICLAQYIDGNASEKKCFTRPLLGDLLSEASKTEEILDAYGAKHNERWYTLRQLVASIKLFSNVGYILLHIKYFLPAYRLLPIHQSFELATDKAFQFACTTLTSTVRSLLLQARALNIASVDDIPAKNRFSDDFPAGQLPFDRLSQRVASPEETVVHLATAFLNLAEESNFLHITQEKQPGNYADLIPESVSEERLRNLEEKFHNLQSLYDTHISDSNVESLDDSLPILRGHITVIFHLLETATAFCHYYERHIPSFARQNLTPDTDILDPAGLLDVLMNYSLMFSSRFILRTRSLCHDMLRRYAIHSRISVPVPRYRGFHVRPSTLIARIVTHYGSEVQMGLEDETYNAGVTLDLFRANEKLNARKRRQLAEEVPKLPFDRQYDVDRDLPGMVRRAIQALFEQNKLVLYERNLSLDELKLRENEALDELVSRCLIQLLAMGKIDLEMDTAVSFSGDQRVLEDIKLLAEHGYGEDDFGNNLPLPPKLSYLRK